MKGTNYWTEEEIEAIKAEKARILDLGDEIRRLEQLIEQATLIENNEAVIKQYQDRIDTIRAEIKAIEDFQRERSRSKNPVNVEAATKHYQSQMKANEKYHSGFDQIILRVPKGDRVKVTSYAKIKDVSVNNLLIQLLNAAIEKDGYLDWIISAPEK